MKLTWYGTFPSVHTCQLATVQRWFRECASSGWASTPGLSVACGARQHYPVATRALLERPQRDS
eukprot:5346460-Amphidinium_carterae.1